MSIELWKSRILTGSNKLKRFSFYNPATNGLGPWIEFTEISDGVSAGRELKLLKFKFEFGEGYLNIADTYGKVREPFFDRAWFFGELTQNENTCMARFRFLDEPSSGVELGTRIFTHWRHGRWNELPKQDIHGKLQDADTQLSFGWSVNGNAYYHELKPVEVTDTPKEAAKAPKSFTPKPIAPTAPAGEVKAEEVKADAAPVKKPKIFVPKSKQTDTPQS